MHALPPLQRHAEIVHDARAVEQAIFDGCDCGWRIRCCVSSGLLTSATAAGDIGAWPLRHALDEQEYCILLEGEVALTDARGLRRTFHAGESFVVPGSFRGTWENLTPVLAHFSTTRRVQALPDAA